MTNPVTTDRGGLGIQTGENPSNNPFHDSHEKSIGPRFQGSPKDVQNKERCERFGGSANAFRASLAALQAKIEANTQSTHAPREGRRKKGMKGDVSTRDIVSDSILHSVTDPLPASRKPHPLPASRKPCPLPACYASTHWFLALTNVLLIFWCYRCRRTFVYVQRRSLRFAHFVRFASFALVLLHRSRCSLFRTVRFAHSDRSLCSLCSTSSASASFPASSSLLALALRSLPESSRRSISATLRYAYAARLAVCAFIWNSLVRFSKSRGKIPTNK